MLWKAKAFCGCGAPCHSVCSRLRTGSPPAHAAGQLVLLQLQAVLQLKGLLIQQPHAVAALCRQADRQGPLDTSRAARAGQGYGL